MTTFFTADTHFRHKNIVHLGDGRPFDDIHHHDEMIIKNFNSVIKPEDTLIHLGDVALGPWPEGLECVRRINGYKMLVPGNHDRISSVEKPARREKFMTDYEDVFDQLCPEVVECFIGEDKVLLSHYPYTGESHEGRADRYTELRPVNEGRVLIHGHTHSNSIVSHENGTLQISVGVDAHSYFPVSEESILQIIKDNA